MKTNNFFPERALTLNALIAGITVCAANPLIGAEPQQNRNPNIIYILVDDMGYGDLGCYGQKLIKTPNLDRMAAEGIRFTNHYSGSTVSAPSRCSLMTGFHTGHTTVRGNKAAQGGEGQQPMPSNTVTIAHLLKKAGYATGLVGKWGLGYPGSESDPLKMGFNYFFGYNCQRQAHHFYPEYLWENDQKLYFPENSNGNHVIYSHDELTQKAVRFISERKDSAFFLYLAYTVPHAELVLPEKYLAKYKGKFPETPYTGTHYGNQDYPHAAYAAMVSHMDEDVGKIRDLLKKLKIDENTVIMFASDNGPHVEGGNDPVFFNSSGGLRGVKRDLYEGGIRTAFITTWTGTILPGRVSAHMSAFWDVMPTLCDIAGIAQPAHTDGISFLPELFGQQQPQHQYLYWEFDEGGKKQAIRMSDRKAVRFYKPEGVITELYNLKTDPHERSNVAEQNSEIVQEMVRLMDVAHAEVIP